VKSIQETSIEELSNSLGAPTKTNDVIPRRYVGPVERRVDTPCDEVERGVIERERRTIEVREDQDGVVKGWALAPPTGPAAVMPGPSHRTEHVATHDRRTNALEAALDDIIADALTTARFTECLSTRPRGEDPLVEFGAADTEGIVLILMWSGNLAVQ
jgi:hypothetical protein